MKVLMLLYTTYENDTRVHRTAKTLAAQGHEVLLLCQHKVGLPAEDEVDGYKILRAKWDGSFDTSVTAKLRDLKFIKPFHYFLLSTIGAPLLWVTKFNDQTEWFWQAVFNTRASWRDIHAAIRRSNPYLGFFLKYPGFPVALVLRSARFGLRLKRRIFGSLTKSKKRERRRYWPLPIPSTVTNDDMLGFIRRREGYYRYSQICLSYAEDFQPDIIHAHDFNALLGAYEVHKELNVPYIYDSHELWVHRNRAEVPYTRLERSWEKRLERKILKGAAFSITVCESIASHLAKHYRIPKPVVLRNTPERRVEEVEKEMDLKKELGFEPDDFVVIYVGRITFNRGVIDILDALPHMDPKVKFVTLGYFDRRFEKIFRKHVATHNLYDKVFSFGPVPASEVSDWVRSVDISLTTMNRTCLSYAYTLPNKLFESLQAEVPIIGPDSVEIIRVIQKYRCGLVYRDGDARHLAQAVNTLVNDPSLVQELKEGAAKAADDLQWEHEQHRLLDAYNGFEKAVA